MRSGRIQADGRKEDLLEPEQISRLFGIRVDITRSDGYYHLGEVCALVVSSSDYFPIR